MALVRISTAVFLHICRMRKGWVLLTMIAAAALLVSFSRQEKGIPAAKLRRIYSQSPDKWPAPFVDSGVHWTELGQLPESPLEKQKDSLQAMIELGKMLFFDTRLSGSGKISCATCHQPELNWTDKKEKSEGHEGAKTARNAPTIANSWFYKKLFWDGRARDLQDQAFAPIVSESEMHSEMPEVIMKLRQVKGYKEWFRKAFGSEGIDPDRMTEAIATFEKTVISRRSRFDEFLAGNSKALSNSEVRGLHLFRTKARCINCHNGPLFTDNQFHRNNLSFDYRDEGLFKVTHLDEDLRKFKTPSLRDVALTGPWMHNGKITSLVSIISRYNSAKFAPGEASPLLKDLGLSTREEKDLKAFLEAISAPAVPFTRPVLPE